MKVDTLGQHITCDDNIVFVLLHSAVVGIEVGGNIVALLIAVGGSHFQHIISSQFIGDGIAKIIHCIYTLAEYHKLLIGVLLWIEQLILQHFYKQLKFGVIAHCIPLLAECVQLFGILVEHLQQVVLEVGSMIDEVSTLYPFCFNILDNFVQFHFLLGLQLLYIVFGSY